MPLLRTDKKNVDFLKLVNLLDASLAITDGKDHEFYHQFNGTDSLEAVVVAYKDGIAVGCGAFRVKSNRMVEIKRMYTLTEYRQQGWASRILTELEKWAAELKYKECILETGINQKEALLFYPKLKYKQIPNFEPYIGVESSFCFSKKL